MSYPSVILADNPVAFFELQESGGSNAKDQVSSANGTYVNVSLGQAGFPAGGVAAVFDGVSSFVDVSAFAATVTFAGPFSVEILMKLGAIPVDDPYNVISNADGAADQYQIVINTDGTITFAVNNADGGYDVATTSIALGAGDIGVGHQLIGLWDGSNVVLYLDNAMVATAACASIASIEDAYPTIGAEAGDVSGDGQRFFSGSLAYASYFNAALNTTQRAAHYNAATTTSGSSAEMMQPGRFPQTPVLRRLPAGR